MAITAHVYQIYIAATPDRVWAAITDSAWTRRYFHGTSFVAPPVEGTHYRTVTADGGDAVDGEIEVMQPPVNGALGRFVQTWHVLYDTAMSEEPPSRVEWTVEAAGDGLTRVRLVHGDLAFSPLTWANVKDGWVWVLDGMKTLVETGSVLPRATALAPTPAPSDGDWHRAQGVEANNAIWGLLGKPDRSTDEDENLLRTAYAAAYHWQRARGAKPENEARASYMIAKALLATDQPDAALKAAERCLAVCLTNGLVDFDLAYAYEVRARALRAVGRDVEATADWSHALGVPIAGSEDAEIVRSDLAFEPVG
jgi:uncharacterized protein YndB with AHSA1/START domain